jgi:hypothetical protein
MLQIKDGARMLLCAQAAQCENTPLGQEFQYNVLGMLRDMSIKDYGIVHAAQFVKMRGVLQNLSFPKNVPNEATTAFLAAHKDEFPSGYEPDRIALQLNAGKKTVIGLANEFDKKNELKAIGKAFFSEAMGKHAENLDDIPQLLTDVGINVQKRQKDIMKALGQIPQHTFDKTLAIGLTFLLGTTAMQMFMQDTQQGARAQQTSMH